MDSTDIEVKICEFCLASNELRDEILVRGSVIEQCAICHSTGGKALPAEDPIVRRIFRALVRLNYSEWDYNEHLGGDSLQSLVASGRAIFNLNSGASDLEFEQAFLILEDGWYPDNPDDIELGGGYCDGCILNGLRDRMDDAVNAVLHRGLEENYFELRPIVAQLLDSIRGDIAKDIATGAELFRARLGVKTRMRKKGALVLSAEKEKHYLPFSGAEIDRPPLSKATEGRFNRSGVSILYLATDSETAIAELRPHPGHLVSTARFELTRSIHVADFSTHDIRAFLSDDRLEDLRRILSFSAVLNLPVQPEYHALYILTHLFSDCIRDAGYEGLSFRSSVGIGHNLACFATDAFSLVPNSENVQEVRALKYELQPRNCLPQTYDPREFEGDGDDILSTLFDGLARNT